MRILNPGRAVWTRLSLISAISVLATTTTILPAIGVEEEKVPAAPPPAASRSPVQASRIALSRLEFAEAAGKLRTGMSGADVRRLLGAPDDIRTQHDPGGISTVGTKEIWRYGTSGHLTTATLGQVYIGEDGRVQYVNGIRQPRLGDLPEERQLRRLLDILGQVSSYNSGSRYNPRTVIRAVNALLPLGKKKAISVIEEFLRVTSRWGENGRDGVFLVLRTLFEVPNDPGYMPPMYVGAPDPEAPDNPKLLPRFPIVIEGDIPFLVVRGYRLGGHPEAPEAHVRFFREHGTLRAKPLVPTAEPLKALDALVKADHWTFHGTANRSFDDEPRGRNMLGNQLLRLLDSVYRTEPNIDGDLLPSYHYDPAGLRKTLADVSQLKIRWDSEADEYVFLDGRTLPMSEPRLYRRETWKPIVPDQALDLELIVERRSSRYVHIALSQRREAGRPDAATLRVCNTKAKDRPIADFSTGGGIGYSYYGRTVELKDGEEITGELTVGGKTYASPVFRP